MDDVPVDADFEADDDEDWDTWEEPEPAPTRCLFTSQIFDSAALCLAHAATAYGLDLAAIAARHRLDIYGRVQLVNYVRSCAAEAGSSPSAITDSINQAGSRGNALPWVDEKYLVPVLPEDPLLYSIPPASSASAAGDPAAGEDEIDDDAVALPSGIRTGASEQQTALLLETINHMRSEMATLLGLDEDDKAPPKDVSDGNAAASSDVGAVVRNTGATMATHDSAAGPKPNDAPSEGQYGSADSASSAYFDSYAKLAIHEEMLGDAVRTQGYRDAIERNAHLFKDKVVLDVGCGSGILSMFAARAGAKRVIAIDASDIIDLAKRIVMDNNLADKVTLVRGTMETLALPDGIEHVDIIISEWMGYALLYESMLPSVLFARDKYLAPGGHVLPTSCDMCISLSDSDRLCFWDDVYGFNMGVIKEQAVREAMVEVVPEESLLSKGAPYTFRTVDCTRTEDKALDFTAPFKVTAARAGKLRSFVIYFDTIFDLSAVGGVCTSFTTSAEAVPTHWKQTSLYLKQPFDVVEGDAIVGTITFSRGIEYKRAYDMTVTYSLEREGTPPQQPSTQMWRME